MGLASVVIALLAASEVSVVVAPGSSCVERSSLSSRLEGAGLRVVNGTSKRLAVTIRPSVESITVHGARSGAPFERRVPAQSETCAGVERVVAALIVSWSLQVPTPEVVEPRPAPVRTSAPPPEPAPEVVVTEEPTPSPEPEVLVAREEAPPSPQPLATVQVTPPSPVAAPPATASWPMTLNVAALGGGGYGPTSTIAPLGQLQVAFSIGRLGALLEGGLQATRAAEVASIRVETTTQWLSLSPRVHFNPHERLQLDVALGFRLWNIGAQSSNATLSKHLDVFALGGVLSAGASLRVFGPMSVVLRGFGSVRNTRARFVIDGVGPILELEPWEAGLMLGVEFRLFTTN